MALKSQTTGWQQGVTLLELMIATAILAIVITVAIPSFSDIGDSQRLLGATEQVYNHIQLARSESVSGNIPAYVNFNAAVSPVSSTITWQYGVSSVNDGCSLAATTPTTANACVVIVDDGDGTFTAANDLVLMRYPSTDWTDVSLGIESFSSGDSQIDFDPVRGTSTSGVINLTSGKGKQLRIVVSLLGRPSICSPGGSVPNYQACP